VSSSARDSTDVVTPAGRFRRLANGTAAYLHPAAGGGVKPRSEAQGCRLQAPLGGAARDARLQLASRRSVARA
jgi:hypothetical protein